MPCAVMAAGVKPEIVNAVEGSNIKISVVDGKVIVINAHVIKTDIQASNGVIHVIVSVLMPK